MDKNIYTTLDSRLQSYLETLMDQVNDEYQPEELTAVLMKAKTGEILAMGQRPTFNPETMEGLQEKMPSGVISWYKIVMNQDQQ